MPSVNKTAPARRARLPAEQRRESILDAATEVFAAAGYRAGKVSDVAARVGVTEPVVFQNFGSKAALFAAVLDRVAGDVHAELDELAGRHQSAAALLADAASLITESGAGDAAWHAAWVIAGHLADLVRRGQAEGGIRAGVDPA